MTALEVLRAARPLIAAPARRTKGAYARRTPDGGSCHPGLAEATCFCIVGAVHRVAGYGNSLIEEVFTALYEACEGHPITFNDTKPHGEVLAAFDRAIASLETRAA